MGNLLRLLWGKGCSPKALLGGKNVTPCDKLPAQAAGIPYLITGYQHLYGDASEVIYACKILRYLSANCRV